MSQLLGYIAAAGPGNLPDYQRPVWSCGHEHATRGEAIECLAEQKRAVERMQRPQQDDPGDSDAA